jgi:ribulose-5-phosphate 4-epimerase/fuculose-1-phosphate aldolase
MLLERKIQSDVKSMVSEAEWNTRIDLAACYRLMPYFGLSDLVYNHITARIPGDDTRLLINPYGFMYEEITASSLITIDIDGNVLFNPDAGGHGYGVNQAGYVIHSAVHAARHDVNCVIHTHSRGGMAVSALAQGLLPLTQTAMRFHPVAYHDYQGPAVDIEERKTLASDLGNAEVMNLDP